MACAVWELSLALFLSQVQPVQNWMKKTPWMHCTRQQWLVTASLTEQLLIKINQRTMFNTTLN